MGNSTFSKGIVATDMETAMRNGEASYPLNYFIDDESLKQINDIVVAPYITTGNLNLYVRPDGDDSNDGLSNTSDRAKGTIYGALQAVPLIVRHQVNIYVADGTYYEDASVYTYYDRYVRNSNSIEILGNIVDKTAVDIRSNLTPREFYFGPKSKISFRYLKMTDIRLNFLGSEILFDTTYFQWSQDNMIVVGNNAYVHFDVDTTIRTTTNSNESLITVQPLGICRVEDIDALDQGGNQAVLFSVAGCGHLRFLGPATIDDFLLGVGIGSNASSPSTFPPRATAIIENGGGPATLTIQNCTTGIKIYNQSHVLYRTAKPNYIANGTNESIQAGSSYQQGQ